MPQDDSNEPQNIQTSPETGETPRREQMPPVREGKTALMVGGGIVLLLIGAIIGYVLRQGEVAGLQQQLNESTARPAAENTQPADDAQNRTESIPRADPSQVAAGTDCMQKVSGARSVLTKAVLTSVSEADDSIQVEHTGTTSTFKWLTVVPDVYDAQCNKTGAAIRDLKINEYITIYLSGETIDHGQILAIQRLQNERS